MDTAENKKLIQDVFEQMARGNTRAMAEAMHENCSWHFPGNWSWSGSWKSKDVVLEHLLRPLMAQFSTYRSTAELVLAEGDRVVVRARGSGTTTRGDAYPQTYCYIFRIGDGKITEVIEYCDTALVERVLVRPA
ncbi:nuclear transport factor 2 family protein [Nocardia sp. NPDC050710]|uniref:nuclear transport factor 2 family protein n=1 Tax=Nocardia sp. NPDC050710 TaxID=3157220 RepID=UPI0033CC86A8